MKSPVCTAPTTATPQAACVIPVTLVLGATLSAQETADAKTESANVILQMATRGRYSVTAKLCPLLLILLALLLNVQDLPDLLNLQNQSFTCFLRYFQIIHEIVQTC